MQMALWFYECGTPFNAAASRQFQIAVEATTHFGSGYKPPPYQLGNQCFRMPMPQMTVEKIMWLQTSPTSLNVDIDH